MYFESNESGRRPSGLPGELRDGLERQRASTKKGCRMIHNGSLGGAASQLGDGELAARL
jgi:hypothetical protein